MSPRRHRRVDRSRRSAEHLARLDKAAVVALAAAAEARLLVSRQRAGVLEASGRDARAVDWDVASQRLEALAAACVVALLLRGRGMEAA